MLCACVCVCESLYFEPCVDLMALGFVRAFFFHARDVCEACVLMGTWLSECTDYARIVCVYVCVHNCMQDSAGVSLNPSTYAHTVYMYNLCNAWVYTCVYVYIYMCVCVCVCVCVKI